MTRRSPASLRAGARGFVRDLYLPRTSDWMMRVIIAKIDDIFFKHSMAPGQLSEALAKISSSRAITRQLRADLKTAISNSPEEGLLAMSKFLASSDVILAATVEANKPIKEPRRATL